MDNETKTNPMNIRLLEVRTELGLTQKDMAEKLQISAPTLNMMEKGRQGVSPEVLITLARQLDVRPDFMLLGKKPVFYRKAEELIGTINRLLDYGNPALQLLNTISKSSMCYYTVMAAFDMYYHKNRIAIDEQIKEFEAGTTEQKE
jgi:transcriptional regulator with XRE-family HTH domain